MKLVSSAGVLSTPKSNIMLDQVVTAFTFLNDGVINSGGATGGDGGNMGGISGGRIGFSIVIRVVSGSVVFDCPRASF